MLFEGGLSVLSINGQILDIVASSDTLVGDCIAKCEQEKP